MSQDSRPSFNLSRRQWLQGAAALSVPALTGADALAAVSGPAAGTAWGVTSDPGIYTQAWNARFTNGFVNPLSTSALPGLTASGFYKTDTGSSTRYTVTAEAGTADVLGIGKSTRIWGYRNFETSVPTFPGRSFQVQRNQAVEVAWRNGLATATGPLPHLMPVDQTITMQTPTSGVPLAVHHHGGDTAPEFDGGPDQWTTPLRRQVGPGIGPGNLESAGNGLRYQYLNTQEASLHWYHDHADSLTRINVNAGLAGLYVVRDSNEALLQLLGVIPKAPYEMAMVLQDRCFDARGDMSYAADPASYPDPAVVLPANQPTHFPEMFGDVILVNGKAWPEAAVEPRPYRVRVLNGSDSRVYVLSFGGLPVYQIGTDLGFLNNGVRMNTVTVAPGERLDLVVDFTLQLGKRIVVSNSGATPFPFGAPATGGATQVMRFKVGLLANILVPLTVPALLPLQSLRRTADTPALPSAAAALSAQPAGLTRRRVLLGEGVDQYGRITPMLGTYDPVDNARNRGTLTFADAPTERPSVGSTEVWEFWNATVDAHPVHMHLVQFRVLDRQAYQAPAPEATAMSNGWEGVRLAGKVQLAATATPAPAHEQGWKDTVVCPPGQVTRVLVNFKRRGKYVYHCHILSHEEHDMMRWYEVI